MTGLYIGVNGVPKKIKKMYVGVNGISKEIKKGYIGVNGIPKLFYQNNILPDRYQQIEYLGADIANSVNFQISTGVIGRTVDPRIVCKFKVTNTGGGSLNVFKCGKFSPNDNKGKSISLWFGSDQGSYQTLGSNGIQGVSTQYNNFLILYDNSVQRWDSSGYTTTPYYVDSRYYNTYPCNERISKYYTYIVDYNNKSNNTARFYLYADDGYFSIPSHNLLVSWSTPSFYPDDSAYVFMAPDWRANGVVLYYSLKMYDTSGNCIRNFYPCRDLNTNYYGFYDFQNKVFYSTNVTNGNGTNPKLYIGPEYVAQL